MLDKPPYLELHAQSNHVRAQFMSMQEADLPDAAEEIVYLDNVVQETLRMYPPAPRYMIINNNIATVSRERLH